MDTTIVVCILTGIFTIAQLYMKRRDDLIKEGILKNAERITKLQESLDTYIQNADYMIIAANMQKFEERLLLNDEVTKRVEIALMIHNHPDQHMIIEGLLEEYNGNHYIYSLASEWSENHNVKLNPRVLTKLCRKAADEKWQKGS